MASPAKIVSDLMTESGKMSHEVQIRMESLLGEVTVDLLSQNGSRFAGLEKSTTITINTSDTAYVLPADFRTAQPTFIEVDSDEDFIREIDVVSEREFYRRRAKSKFPQDLTVFVERRTVGGSTRWYLVLGAAPTTSTYYKFFYWREPKTNDTNIIQNEAIPKEGVRSKMPGLFPAFQVSLAAYVNMRHNFKEDPSRLSTSMQVKPSLQTQRVNRLQHKIGRGG